MTLPGRPPHSFACISSLRNLGWNVTVSTPFCHTSSRGHPSPRSSSWRIELVTIVTSDARVHTRMKSHIGFTSPAHVYRGM